MSTNWPQFQPETIEAALFALLQTSTYPFQTYDRRGQLPENVPAANQPYLGLVHIGDAQVENQAQGLEKWLLHFRALVYIRADAVSSGVPATEMNKALQAIVQVMRTPTAERQTLGGLVDNAWIEGTVLRDTGILDQQCALLIPIVVDTGL
ncbi:MAG TPA: hypothetical protein VND65_14945 [Candidatus Binatia bacterium]|nr:hypothetical protein [Candidatus Binatia bacterium]